MRTKEALKQEINNITSQIVAKREDRLKNATYGDLDKKNTNGNFRVPEVELLDRTFNESSRFYAIGPS